MSNTVDYSTLESLLRENRGRTWYFVNPGGNFGDQLIYAGANALAQRIDLKCQHFDTAGFAAATVPPGAAIYLHGSGGFNTWGKGSAFRNLARAVSVDGALVVQGPHTCEVNSSLVAEQLLRILETSRAAAVHFYARERTSESYLAESLPDNVLLHIDHDTALHLRAEDLLRLAGLDRRPRGRYELLVSRRDDEAPHGDMLRFKSVVEMDPAYYCASFQHWIRVHAFASRIITNRLHSAICGALLGVPVIMSGGGYHKNRSVWEFSLRARGVEWCDSFKDQLTIDDSAPLMPRWLARSWKVQRLMMRLRGVPA